MRTRWAPPPRGATHLASFHLPQQTPEDIVVETAGATAPEGNTFGKFASSARTHFRIHGRTHGRIHDRTHHRNHTRTNTRTHTRTQANDLMI